MTTGRPARDDHPEVDPSGRGDAVDVRGIGDAHRRGRAVPRWGDPVTGRVLIAGIGDVLLGDDGFGVEVVSRLSTRDVPPEVVVGDFGVAGPRLAHEILDGDYETTIFVDALARGGPPGTLYVLDLTAEGAGEAPGGRNLGDGPGAGDSTPPGNGRNSGGDPVGAHTRHPAVLLALLRRLGGAPGRVLVVGCEPRTVAEGIGLSEPVAAVVDEAVRRVRELVDIAMERGGLGLPRRSR